MEKFRDNRKGSEHEGSKEPAESESNLAEQVLALNEEDKYWEIAKRAGFKDAYDDGEFTVIQTFTPDRSQVATIKIYDKDNNLCFSVNFSDMKAAVDRHEREKPEGKGERAN